MESNKSITVKSEIADFYTRQSNSKTTDFGAWLDSGSVRIPESKTYYYFEDRKIFAALKLAQLKPHADILEIGCNLGQMTFCLGSMGFTVTGVDICENVIEKSQIRAKHYGMNNVQFKVNDAENLSSLGSNTFDLVCSFSAVRYMPNPLVALKEMYSVLKPRGCAVIDFPNKYCPWFTMLKPFTFIKRHIHDTYYSIAEARHLMAQAGFRNITHTLLLFSHKSLPEFLVPFLRVSDFILERMPLVNSMAAIIMTKGEKL